MQAEQLQNILERFRQAKPDLLLLKAEHRHTTDAQQAISVLSQRIPEHLHVIHVVIKSLTGNGNALVAGLTIRMHLVPILLFGSVLVQVRDVARTESHSFKTSFVG